MVFQRKEFGGRVNIRRQEGERAGTLKGKRKAECKRTRHFHFKNIPIKVTMTTAVLRGIITWHYYMVLFSFSVDTVIQFTISYLYS